MPQEQFSEAIFAGAAQVDDAGASLSDWDNPNRAYWDNPNRALDAHSAMTICSRNRWTDGPTDRQTDRRPDSQTDVWSPRCRPARFGITCWAGLCCAHLGCLSRPRAFVRWPPPALSPPVTASLLRPWSATAAQVSRASRPTRALGVLRGPVERPASHRAADRTLDAGFTQSSRACLPALALISHHGVPIPLESLWCAPYASLLVAWRKRAFRWHERERARESCIPGRPHTIDLC